MKNDSNLDSLYSELAGRFGALSQLFSQFSSPKAVQGLIDSLTSEDPTTFKQFTDPFDIPILGKCFWVRDMIETVVATPAGLVEECWLRDDLTPSERRLYLEIASRYLQGGMVAAPPAQLIVRRDESVIPPGPFLDELKANGLVTCKTRMSYNTVITRGFSMPERHCI